MEFRKFRGKAIHPSMQGKWVYGYYVMGDLCEDKLVLGDHWIYTESGEGHQVDPETVGQSTGLYDRYDKEIYEGAEIKAVANYNEWTAQKHKVRYVASDGGFQPFIDFDKVEDLFEISVVEED